MFLNNYKYPYLNLGCGNKTHPDWINIDFAPISNDVLQLNLLKRIPLDDKCIKYIYHSHILEHFTESEGIAFISECYRLLQNGGILRIVLPDLENIVRSYINLIDNIENYNEIDFHKFHRWYLIEMFDQTVREYPGGLMKESLATQDEHLKEFMYNRIGRIEVSKKQKSSKRKSIIFRIKRKLTKILLTEKEYSSLNLGLFRKSGEIHKWMYDKYSLTKLLQDTGFKKVEIMNHESSNIPEWSTYELDVRNGKILNPTSLYIEAIK